MPVMVQLAKDAWVTLNMWASLLFFCWWMSQVQKMIYLKMKQNIRNTVIQVRALLNNEQNVKQREIQNKYPDQPLHTWVVRILRADDSGLLVTVEGTLALVS